MHSTDDLEDGYIGSGTRLWRSIKKHGRESFNLEILEFCLDRETLKKREAELITEEKLQDPMCMNLTLGGGGGWDIVNKTYPIEIRIKNGKSCFEKHGEIFEKCRRISHSSEVRKKVIAKYGPKHTAHFTGKTHSIETKQKMSETKKLNQSQNGNKNSQFGTCWIFHEDQGNKKIKLELLQDFF